jgi:uncharacterized protein YecT (DUF1311 family)
VYGAPPEVLRGTDWYRQCLRVKNEKPARQVLDNTSREKGRCDPAALYYDTLNQPDAGKADWQRVHACAARTDSHGVLMMLYANGAGMTPQFDLALMHACSIQSPVDEMKSQLAALTRGWNGKEQLGLELASKAVHYFAQHRVDYETDAGGNATRSLQLDVQAAELDQFAADILDAEGGKAPQFSEGEFASLEEKMNAVYRQFMLNRPASTSYLGTIRKTGVEKTQRAWLAYRDAMELFGSIRHPQVSGAGWRAQLTARRLKQLTELDNAAAGR